MIKDKEVARHVSEVLLRCGAEINNSIRHVKENCSDEELEMYKQAMGVVMGEILLKGLNPIYSQHPDIKPEELQ
ncbi:MAG TPA: hypothetical protein EYG18_03680 [Micavibrio sp.]|nr:hypothetical protein [Micavibrio sp.]HIL28350.1 hypothetical protein [Micavibrio sp.]